MRVHIETGGRFLMSGTVGIYIFDRLGDPGSGKGRILRLQHPGVELWRWQELTEGADPEPSIELPTEVLGALVAAGGDHLPPSSAMERHLNDATAIRDRLLAIVETAHGIGTINADAPPRHLS